MPLTSLFCVELFSGSAGLTASLRECHFSKSFGVDSVKIRHSKAPILTLNLAKASNQKLVLQWIAHPLCCFVHMGVPCGTCSRAREIRMGRYKHGPKPLRNASNPDGKPGLKGLDLRRTALANLLYKFAFVVAAACNKYGTPWTVENPSNSWLWQTSFWKNFVRRSTEKVLVAKFQNCAYGGARPKWTTLAGTLPNLNSMCLTCPGDHKHEPWGVISTPTGSKFATSTEAEYPIGLCCALAYLVQSFALEHGAISPPQSLASVSAVSLVQSRAVTGELVRASKLPPLVPEFSRVLVATHQNKPSVEIMKWSNKAEPCASCKQLPSCKTIEPPVKLLRLSPITTKPLMGDKKMVVKDECSKKATSQTDEPPWEAAWAVPWSPEAFVEEAVKVSHPKSLGSRLPEPLVRAVKAHVDMEAYELDRVRRDWAKRWVHESSLLEKEERADRAKLSPNSAAVILKQKRLVVWERMLSEVHYPDVALVQQSREGFSLAGSVEATGLFEAAFSPASMTVDELDQKAAMTREAIFASTSSSGDDYIDGQVWSKTLEECSKGWLDGPLGYDLNTLDKNVSVSRRFGIIQGEDDEGKPKVRPIDDFSESLINSTVSTSEKVLLHTVDFIGALLCKWFGSCAKAGVDSSLVARSVDLKSAYRQLPISEASLRHAMLSVYDPSAKRPCLFQLRCLPFGATSSVAHFLRSAHSLWFLGCTAGYLMWSNYFDDFLCHSPPLLAKNAGAFIEILLGLTGWIFAKEGSKHVEFSQLVAVLGVEIDLSHSKNGQALFGNTEKRVRETMAAIADILECSSLTKAGALQLRGRLGFCESQIFGRIGNLAMKSLVDHAYRHPFCGKVNERLSSDLIRLSERLGNRKARKVDAVSDRTWILFTDASFEPDADGSPFAGLGAVLYNQSGQPCFQFSIQLSQAQIALVTSGDQKTPIFELEVLALVAAVTLWESKIARSQLVCYLDNNGARDVTIRGYSQYEPATLFVEVLLSLEERAEICPWYARVPSRSNPADEPSRNKPLANVPMTNSDGMKSLMDDLLQRAY